MKKYRAGVIGIGFIGAAHIEALRRLGNVEVVALATTTDPMGKALRYFVPKGYFDYKVMINDENLDVVHICTPNDTHKEMAVYVMNRGIHVVCEKPLAMSVDEADQMIAKAKETGVLNGVNYHNRFYPMTAELRERVKDGDLGKIHSVYGEFTQDWLLYDTDYNWRIDASQSGSTRVVSDIGSHWMDLVEYITELKIIEVFADFMILHPTRKKPTSGSIKTYTAIHKMGHYMEVPVDTEDHANVLFRFSNGAVGSAVFSQVTTGRKAKLGVSFTGMKQTAYWSTDTCNEIWLGERGGCIKILEKGGDILHQNVAINVGYSGGHPEGYPDAIKNTFRAMYAGIHHPQEHPDYANFEDGKRALILCEKILQSAQTQSWVKIGD